MDSQVLDERVGQSSVGGEGWTVKCWTRGLDSQVRKFGTLLLVGPVGLKTVTRNPIKRWTINNASEW